MLDVIIALIPAFIAAICLFGPKSAAITAISIICCVLFEFISRKIMKRSNTLSDLSAIVTGILLAFNLPVSIPLWMIPIGAFFAIVVAKQFFGGIGQNFVNPALIGRIVLMVSFPGAMSSWTNALAWHRDDIDTVSSATPLATLSELFKSRTIDSIDASSLPALQSMFFGHRAGCLGEVCAIALILGGIYLIARRVISPAIPAVFIGTVAVFMFIASKGNIYFTLYELLSGGLLLGAIFMATDYATCPIRLKGKIIYAVGCGIITAAIRLFGSLPEGVSFSIIIMNILVPHIERLTAPRAFGEVKEKKSGSKEAKQA